jgi:hypothetical protein
MSISPVSISSPPAVHVNQPVKVIPFKRDRDGDYINSAPEANRAAAAESSKGGSVLDIKA